jgi:hypothetical protein
LRGRLLLPHQHLPTITAIHANCTSFCDTGPPDQGHDSIDTGAKSGACRAFARTDAPKGTETPTRPNDTHTRIHTHTNIGDKAHTENKRAQRAYPAHPSAGKGWTEDRLHNTQPPIQHTHTYARTHTQTHTHTHTYIHKRTKTTQPPTNNASTHTENIHIHIHIHIHNYVHIHIHIHTHIQGHERQDTQLHSTHNTTQHNTTQHNTTTPQNINITKYK